MEDWVTVSFKVPEIVLWMLAIGVLLWVANLVLEGIKWFVGRKWRRHQNRAIAEMAVVRGNKVHLMWIYNRLLNHHKDEVNQDFMIKLKDIIDRIGN